jgi:hypothetical protein
VLATDTLRMANVASLITLAKHAKDPAQVQEVRKALASLGAGARS